MPKLVLQIIRITNNYRKTRNEKVENVLEKNGGCTAKETI